MKKKSSQIWTPTVNNRNIKDLVFNKKVCTRCEFFGDGGLEELKRKLKVYW